MENEKAEQPQQQAAAVASTASIQAALAIKQSPVLSPSQRDYLVNLVESGDVRTLELLQRSESPQQLAAALLELAARLPASASQDDARMDTSEDGPGDTSAAVADREGTVHAAVYTIQTGPNKVAAKAAIKAIVKLLGAILKKPDDKKARQLRQDNLIVKKFVLGTAGGKELFLAMGFVEEEIGKAVYLSLEPMPSPQDLALIQKAADLLEGAVQAPKVQQQEAAAEAPVSPRERKLCAGSCGLWGDPDREDLCSVCYKKKYGIVNPPVQKKAATLCTKGCGFYGQEQWDGMCSKCFNADQSNPKHWRRKFYRARIRLRGVLAFRSLIKVEVKQVNKSRCWKCNRKVGLLGIECRCRYVFCGQHRYADEHDCSYDFKKRHQRLIANQNKLVQHDKFERLDEE